MLRSSSSRKVELSLIFFFSPLLHLFLAGTPVHSLEPRSLTYIFLLQFFFLGSVPVIVIAIVTPAVMEKRLILATVGAALWGCFLSDAGCFSWCSLPVQLSCSRCCCKVRFCFLGTSGPSPVCQRWQSRANWAESSPYQNGKGLVFYCVFSSPFQLTMGSDEWVRAQMEGEEQNASKRAGPASWLQLLDVDGVVKLALFPAMLDFFSGFNLFFTLLLI